MLDVTHDPGSRSWVESANTSGHDFPIQNLPFGMFIRDGEKRVGVAIGDKILDLTECAKDQTLGTDLDALILACTTGLNALMGAPKAMVRRLRHRLFELLSSQNNSTIQAREDRYLVDRLGAKMATPCEIRNYTDFLTSAHHTERHGRFKGLEVPLPPAFKYLPVAYHGRASSITVSGSDVVRPHSQWKSADGLIQFGLTPALDFELEMAAFVGEGNILGSPIPLHQAREHIFGYCLLNDWSNRAGQWWEQILGPFLGKSFGTTISPWIITEEALLPFRTSAPVRDKADPETLPYLTSHRHQCDGGLEVMLEAQLHTEKMRAVSQPPEIITRTRLSHLYWTFSQMLTHHASNGCNLQAGDLLGSGTISGPEPESMACMAEKTEAGKKPFELSNGETRLWLEDGDEVILTARAEKAQFASIGFGECRGRVLPGVDWPR